MGMRIKTITAEDLQKIRCVADYQFGKDVGAKFFLDNVGIVHSRNTGKIRYIYFNEELLATLRPTTGLFILTLIGAKRMIKVSNPLRLWVKVEDYAEPFVAKGRSAFAKHVIEADPEIRPKEEVIVISQKNEVLAVGRALLTGREMIAFERGIAVQVRRGIAEKS
ncbi:pseudouridine synthase [Candidatus Bathyarchaeota archaeon]|nr:pseudouridine synthase [Candidatus Bathyarchaeota archaeon]